VVSVVKWMNDPAWVQFSGKKAVRNSRSLITVCGLVNGRNTAGHFVGFQPLVGMLMGPGADADFVLVGIDSSDQERAEVTSLCRASGIYGVGVRSARQPALPGRAALPHGQVGKGSLDGHA